MPIDQKLVPPIVFGLVTAKNKFLKMSWVSINKLFLPLKLVWKLQNVEEE